MKNKRNVNGYIKLQFILIIQHKKRYIKKGYYYIFIQKTHEMFYRFSHACYSSDTLLGQKYELKEFKEFYSITKPYRSIHMPPFAILFDSQMNLSDLDQIITKLAQFTLFNFVNYTEDQLEQPLFQSKEVNL